MLNHSQTLLFAETYEESRRHITRSDMSSIIQPRRRMSLVGKSIHQALRIQESTLASKLLSSLLWAAEQTEPDRDLELRDVYMPHSRANGDVTIPSLYMTSTYQAT